ncbi:histidine utilization repressor, partial [Vibrio agarivorans]
VQADAEVSANLGTPHDHDVFHTILVHCENGTPIQVEDRYVNPRWVPDYLTTDFDKHTPNEVLVAACPISNLEHVVEAILPESNIAKWLEITEMAPCLRMVRRTWSNSHLISYARLVYPGERYKLRSAASEPTTME